MKIKILVLLLMFCVIPFSSVGAEGHLSSEQLKLGGLSATDTREFVESVYGMPEKKCQRELVYIYGKTFRVKFFRKDTDSSIWDIQVIADNGLGTADGIKVGMEAKVLEQTYGSPDSIKKGTKGTIYKYCGAGVDRLKSLSFYVRDGIIRSISLHWAD